VKSINLAKFQLIVDDDSPEAMRMANPMISDERLSNIGQRRRYTQ